MLDKLEQIFIHPYGAIISLLLISFFCVVLSAPSPSSVKAYFAAKLGLYRGLILAPLIFLIIVFVWQRGSLQAIYDWWDANVWLLLLVLCLYWITAMSLTTYLAGTIGELKESRKGELLAKLKEVGITFLTPKSILKWLEKMRLHHWIQLVISSTGAALLNWLVFAWYWADSNSRWIPVVFGCITIVLLSLYLVLAGLMDSIRG
jgi:hypothetical protein